jgi:hypothetical protein
MSQITIGSAVRLYYDEDTFDEGCVTHAADDRVVVDFYDWIAEWPGIASFGCDRSYLGVPGVFVPLQKGTITTRFD